MASKATTLYQQLQERMQKIADMRYASAVLQWDQETYLPAKGASRRGQQVATLSETAHEWFTADNTGELLKQLAEVDGLDAAALRNVELLQEDYTKLKKMPSSHVRAVAEATQTAFHRWMEARNQNSFSLFSGALETLVQLKKEEAEILGYEKHPYNALLNDHDKGSTVEQLDALFLSLQKPLKELRDQIMSQQAPDSTLLQQHFPKNSQWDFGMQVLRDIGYDFEAGRQDIAEHPFTISFCAGDVRITTRIDESDFTNMTWSTIHEAGHALYEQGLPEQQYGLPLGEAASFSIHESQSRLWENHVGRSQPFFEYLFPLLNRYFPENFKEAKPGQLYRAVNLVKPSLIRTEADELTYHFHVMIRYEIEKMLLESALSPKDIPEVWNSLYKQYLGIDVPDDKRGCLQDVHWSHGSFGYFPTYSLGSFYAAQFYAQAEKSIPDLAGNIRNGRFQPLLAWLNTSVFSQGRWQTSEEMCLKISGERLNTRYFMDYLLDKYRNIYHL
jgi:carboxypeptidase Taq